MEPPTLKLVLEFFVVATILLFFLLQDLGKKAWKRLEYVMVIFAATGLIPTTIESQRWMQTNEIHWRGDALDTSASWIQDYLESSRMSLCQVGDKQPINDKITATQRDAICKWIDQNETDVLNEVKIHSPIAARHAQSLPDSTSFSQDVKERFDRYQTRLDTLQSLEKRSKETGSLQNANSGLDALSKVFGPYLLALALALKIAQTHSEIKHP